MILHDSMRSCLVYHDLGRSHVLTCGLRKLPSPIADDLRYLRRLSSSCDYSAKTLSQRYPDSRGCTFQGGYNVVTSVPIFLLNCLIASETRYLTEVYKRGFVAFVDDT
ncbi:hypothetical protein ANTQUA_LOCUS5720 [Anthophora quadrimaculata]